MLRADFKRIFVQKKIFEDLEASARARAILARFPKSEMIEVESHWRLPALFDADPKEWLRTKNDILVLGLKSGLGHRVNGRSADFIAASNSNGCLSACQYCYVARRKGGSNPLTLFVNIDAIADSIENHSRKFGPKLEANQTDPRLWTYDIGCNADLSLDAAVCDHPGFLIERFAEMAYAKATFATKTVHDEYWLRFDPKGHTRIRYSIMPQAIARYVDIRTSPISARIRSVNELVRAGYEVHLNFSPIIPYGGDQWKSDWLETFREIDEVLSAEAKRQLACEAFLLSHSADAHELNLSWNPKGEEFLWEPSLQTSKSTKPDVLVYRPEIRREALGWFLSSLRERLPYCPIRYAF